ncbi:hypothetical protein A8B82_08390 [Sulfitobacter sp. EhC04]|nr:hypothetical protein A8B82_08390 [Sulfitobacter sp. EhC04]
MRRRYILSGVGRHQHDDAPSACTISWVHEMLVEGMERMRKVGPEVQKTVEMRLLGAAAVLREETAKAAASAAEGAIEKTRLRTSKLPESCQRPSARPAGRRGATLAGSGCD